MFSSSKLEFIVRLQTLDSIMLLLTQGQKYPLSNTFKSSTKANMLGITCLPKSSRNQIFILWPSFFRANIWYPTCLFRQYYFETISKIADRTLWLIYFGWKKKSKQIIEVLLKWETIGDTLTGIRRTRYFELGKSIFEFWLTLSQRDHSLEKTIEWMIDRMIVCFQLVLT